MSTDSKQAKPMLAISDEHSTALESFLKSPVLNKDAASKLSPVFDNLINQLNSTNQWEEVFAHAKKTLTPSKTITQQQVDAFFHFFVKHGGFKKVTEQVQLQLNNEHNHNRITPMEKMSELGCMAVCAGGILGTAFGCIPCGVGAIGVAAAGGCV